MKKKTLVAFAVIICLMCAAFVGCGRGSDEEKIASIVKMAEAEIKSEAESFKDIMDIGISSKGKSIVYTYKYVQELDVSETKANLDLQKSNFKNVSKPIFDEMKELNINDLMVVFEFFTKDGDLITSYTFDEKGEVGTSGVSTDSNKTSQPTPEVTPEVTAPSSDAEKMASLLAIVKQNVASTIEMYKDTMKITVSTRGNAIVYTYQYVMDIGNIEIAKEALDLSKESLEQAAATDISAMKLYGISNPSVIFEYINSDGTMIASYECD